MRAPALRSPAALRSPQSPDRPPPRARARTGCRADDRTRKPVMPPAIAPGPIIDEQRQHHAGKQNQPLRHRVESAHLVVRRDPGRKQHGGGLMNQCSGRRSSAGATIIAARHSDNRQTSAICGNAAADRIAAQSSTQPGAAVSSSARPQHLAANQGAAFDRPGLEQFEVTQVAAEVVHQAARPQQRRRRQPA